MVDYDNDDYDDNHDHCSGNLLIDDDDEDDDYDDDDDCSGNLVVG